jgi:t-SNARE complex subunit (syntaxin)
LVKSHSWRQAPEPLTESEIRTAVSEWHRKTADLEEMERVADLSKKLNAMHKYLSEQREKSAKKNAAK